MPLTPGARLGPYEILSALGAGGMGEVYRARDTNLDRDVAIKVLPEAVASDPERLARFDREAKTLAALNHPHIAAIYGLERSSGMTALVMELVEGPTLADRITQGAIPIDEALPIAKQIAEALEAAHEQGIIHRDLKPANVKVRPDGTVKVLDFGLAKALEPTSGTPIDATASPTITSPAMMTGVGMILGTAAYMAPEQAKGRDADKRSDIWAFGCVLYEMLVGQGPFTGDDVTDTLANVLKRDLDCRLMPADVPAAIVTLVRRCLVKDRRERIGDIAVVQFLLSEHSGLASAPVTAAPIGPTISPTRVIAIGAAALLTALVAGASTWFLWPVAGPPSPMVRFTISLPEGQQFTNLTRQVLAISPDGTLLVYTQGSQLHKRSLGELEAHVVPGTNGLGPILPVFSPDGNSIAFFASDGTLRRVPVNGGTAQVIARVDNPFGMSWGEDGILFGGGADGIFRVSPKGGEPEQLVRVDKDQSAYGPQILPGGEFVLFSLATSIAADRWDTADIVVQSLVSGERTTLIAGGSEGRYVSSGHLVYAVSGSLFAVAFDPSTLRIGAATASVLTGVGRASPPVAAGTAKFSVSDTGSLIYAAGPADTTSALRKLILSDRDGNSVPLKVEAGQYTHPRVSPDGDRLAMGREDGKNSHVWIYELAGTSSMRRLTLEGRNRYPVWSADGMRIAFQSDRQGDAGIFSQRIDGTGEVVQLTTAPQGAAHMPESWSPDGKHLLFTEQNGSAYVLFSLSIDDKVITPFGNVRSSAPIGAGFSPHGDWVTYATTGPDVGTRSADRGVFIQSFPTGARHALPKTAADFHPVWSADGKELFYVPAAARPYVAVTVRTEPVMIFGAAVELSDRIPKPRLTFPEVRGYDVTPDGKFIGLIPVASPDAPGPVSRQEIGVILNWFDELKRLVPTK